MARGCANSRLSEWQNAPMSYMAKILGLDINGSTWPLAGNFDWINLGLGNREEAPRLNRTRCRWCRCPETPLTSCPFQSHRANKRHHTAIVRNRTAAEIT